MREGQKRRGGVCVCMRWNGGVCEVCVFVCLWRVSLPYSFQRILFPCLPFSHSRSAHVLIEAARCSKRARRSRAIGALIYGKKLASRRERQRERDNWRAFYSFVLHWCFIFCTDTYVITNCRSVQNSSVGAHPSSIFLDTFYDIIQCEIPQCWSSSSATTLPVSRYHLSAKFVK